MKVEYEDYIEDYKDNYDYNEDFYGYENEFNETDGNHDIEQRQTTPEEVSIGSLIDWLAIVT